MAGVAHDVSILIDQEGIVGLDTCVNIGVIGAVPLRAGREYAIGLGDRVDIAEFALAKDDISCVLGKTGGNSVAIGVSPCAETAFAAGVNNSLFDLGQDLLEVACLFGQVKEGQLR